MEQYNKELTPVYYNDASIIVLHHSIGQNRICFRMHWHERLEIIRVTHGEMYVTSGSHTFKLQVGDLTIFPPRMAHKGYTVDHAVKYDVLMFDVRAFYNEAKVCQRYLPALYDGRAHFNPIITDADTILCFDNIATNDARESLEAVSDIYKLFYLLFEKNSTELHINAHSNHQILEMIKYIEAHYSENLTIDSCADHFGYSKEHFCRKFKKAIGLTPMNYLNIFRMEEAYKMLMHKKNRIPDVAEACGFNDANYFTRCFKKHFGIPPTKVK